MNFGQQVLSHPLIVEAVHEAFSPVVTRNNVGGAEAVILKRYKEPTWNNPVVRFLDPKGKDLIPRRDRVWSVGGVAQRMVAALRASKRPVPVYLQLLAQETATKKAKKATFAMHCYWEGEARLGSLNGVLNTKSAWLDGKEVVEVDYDETLISYVELLIQAQKMECASTVFARDDKQLEVAKKKVGNQVKRTDKASRVAKASDQLYRLNHSRLRYLPLSRLQQVKVNAALGLRRDPMVFLSPGQRFLARKLTNADKKKLQGLRMPPRSPYAWVGYADRLKKRL